MHCVSTFIIIQIKIMKKIYTLFVALIIMGCLMAQSPERFNYQAVVRGSGGSLIVNSEVGIKISILQGSTSGTAVCIEEFSPTTNDYGLVTLEIGSVNSVDFELIDWSAGPYFIKIELDENGGISYSEMGTSQLLSVPYALHATTAGRTTGDSIWKKSAGDIYFVEGKVGIGRDNPTSKLSIFNDPLGELLDDKIDWFRLEGKSGGNSDNLYLFHRRHMDGTNWNSSEIKIQKQVDSSPMHYISFMGLPGNISRLEFGYSTIPYMSIDRYGKVGIGTTSPTKPLDVVGDIKMGNDITIWEGTRALSLRQDNLNSYVSNKENFVGNGSTDNGSLNLHGQGGLSLRYGNAGSAGTIGLYLSTAGNIGIGTTSPNASAVLDVQSTTQGFLPPRLSFEEIIAISNPAEGLVVYNTDSKLLNLYNGTKWLNMDGSSAMRIGMSYAGGIIFYVDGTGIHGLVCAANDQSTGAEWGCYGTGIPGADGTAVGTGAQNTIDIEAGCTTAGTAADICANLSLNDYNDWFLPSKDELNLMYTNLHLAALGGFASAWYWSSTESSSGLAWRQYFGSGLKSTTNKGFHQDVRAVRAF